jgi:hypothetical protein
MAQIEHIFEFLKSDLNHIIFFGIGAGLVWVALATHKTVPPVAYDGTDMRGPKKRFAILLFLIGAIFIGIGFYLYR